MVKEERVDTGKSLKVTSCPVYYCTFFFFPPAFEIVCGKKDKNLRYYYYYCGLV